MRFLVISNSTADDMASATRIQGLLERSDIEVLRLEYDQRFSHPYLPDMYKTPFHLCLIDGDPLVAAPRLCGEDYVRLCGDDLDFSKLNAKEYWKNNFPETVEFLDPESMTMQRFRGIAWRFESLVHAVRPDALMISHDGNPPLALMMMGKALKLGLPAFFMYPGFLPESVYLELYGCPYERDSCRLDAMYAKRGQEIHAAASEAAFGRAESVLRAAGAAPADKTEANALEVFRKKFPNRTVLLFGQEPTATGVYMALRRLGFPSLQEMYRLILDSQPDDAGLIVCGPERSTGDLFQVSADRKNILILEKTNPASLLSKADASVTFNASECLAAAVAGLPVLTLGSPYYSGKGFTLDWDGQTHLREYWTRLFDERPDHGKMAAFLCLMEQESLLAPDLPPKDFSRLCRRDEFTPVPDARKPFWTPGRGPFNRYDALLDNYAHLAYKNYSYHEIMARSGLPVSESDLVKMAYSPQSYLEYSRTDLESNHKIKCAFASHFLHETDNVLYLCCAGNDGFGANILADYTNKQVLAFDSRPEETKWAEKVYFSKPNLTYINASPGAFTDIKLSDKKEYFDVVVMFGYLEHLPDPRPFLNKIRSLMKNNAVLIGSVPHNTIHNPIGNIQFHMRHYTVALLMTILDLQHDEYIKIVYQDFMTISENKSGSEIVFILSKDSDKLSGIDSLIPFTIEPRPTGEIFLPASFFTTINNNTSSLGGMIPLSGDKAGFIFWGPHLPLPPGFWHVEFFFEPASTIAGDTGFAGRKIRLDISTRNGEKIQYSLTLHESELLNGAHAWLHVQSADDLFEFRAYYEDDAHAGCPAADIFFTGVKLSHVTEREFSPHSTFLLKKAVKDEVKELLRTIYRSSRSLAKVCLRSAKKTAEDKVVPYAYSCMKSLLPGGGDVSGTSQSAISFNTVKSGDEFEDYMNRLNDINLEQTNYCTYQCIFCNRNSMTRKKGFMSLEDLAWVIKNITCRNSFSGHLQLPGWGESFLDTLLPEKIAMLRKNFPRARIMTTTTLGVNLQAGYFQDLVRSGLNLLQVSVRGLTRETYAAVHGVDRFELVMNNMKIIAEELSRTTQKCDVLVRGRLDASNAGNSLAFCPDNKQTAAKFQDKISSYGFYYSEDTLLNSGNTYIHNKLGPNPEPCSIYKGKLANTLIVTWDLHVLPCARIGNNEVVLGNLREKSLREIFYDQPRRDFLQAHKTLQLKEKYPFCWYCRQDEAGWSKAS